MVAGIELRSAIIGGITAIKAVKLSVGGRLKVSVSDIGARISQFSYLLVRFHHISALNALLKLEQRRFLDIFLDKGYELHRLKPIQQPMIVREGHNHLL